MTGTAEPSAAELQRSIELRQMRRASQMRDFLAGREVYPPRSNVEIYAALKVHFAGVGDKVLNRAANEIDRRVREYIRGALAVKIKRGPDGQAVMNAVKAQGAAAALDRLDAALQSGSSWKFAKAWQEMPVETAAWVRHRAWSHGAIGKQDGPLAPDINGRMALPHPDAIAPFITAARASVSRRGRPLETQQDDAVECIARWWAMLSGQRLINPDRDLKTKRRVAGWLDLLGAIVSIYEPIEIRFAALKSGAAAKRVIDRVKI